MRLRIGALCLVLLATIIVRPALGADNLDGAALQAGLETAISQYNLPGGALLVRSPTGNIWMGSAGLAEYDQGVAWRPTLRSGLGSVTKTFTSTAVLMLIDAGKLSLGQTVEDVLPGLLTVGDQVTVEHLLGMTSGLNHYETTDYFIQTMNAAPNTFWSITEIARLCDGLTYQPGDHFDYNNGNYFILGAMIEQVAGMSWHDYLRTYILDPLGMSGTGFMIDRIRPSGDSAAPCGYQNGQVIDATYAFSPSIGGPSGCMYSTVYDMLTWMDAFMEGSLLSPELQAKRMTKAVEIGSGMYFGLGIAFRSNGAVGFAGNLNDVYSSEWERLEGWDIIVLINGQSGPPDGANSSASVVYYYTMKALGIGGY